MKPIGLNQLREMYLSFFESKEHLRMDSAPLVPINDPSLLLINSGMAPLKAFFTGAATPPRPRVTTCQKCIRTPDIERVGKTARHGTFFEMLGNFSFGDYFKKESTAWAWEFVTEVLKIPKEKLWVTIYEEDDEAEEIWATLVGVPRERIVRLGKADNFWEHGTGPCGPCSEIYYDHGVEAGCDSPDCQVGCDCDRFIEFWNLVFTQFDSDGKGTYTPLASPNIDTGMGLERLAVIMQGVDNIFEVDTIADILSAIARRAGVSYGDNENNDISLRVITDHIRSTTFMIADGVSPSNEGRGYVLRRLLRRAARHGHQLGIKGNFLADIAKVVIRNNKKAYPELAGKAVYIAKIITLEESRFYQALEQGLELLHENICLKTKTPVSGEVAFRLHDTYGFPLDLTQDILFEYGISVDEEGFHELMEKQRTRARAARNNASSWDDAQDDDDSDKEETPAESRAHSATHLLQAALRAELGEHVEQKGSFVGPDRLRFDFSHFEPMSPEALTRVQNAVNEKILAAIPTTVHKTTLDEAKAMGAIALFGDKYGETVRVVQFGDFSTELCSGKHVKNTGNIGLFKINSETGSAAGVRRIDASVGLGVLDIIENLNEKNEETKHKHLEEVKALKQEIKKAKTESGSQNIVPKTKEISGITVHSLQMQTSDSDILKNAADTLKNQSETCVVVVGGADSEGVKFVAAATEPAIKKGAHAGNIVREVSQIAGGKGGGKPNFAQAGGTNPAKVAEALEKVFELIK